MAETPFSPESGATSGGTAPEDGIAGTPVEAGAAAGSEPVPATPEPSETAAVVEAVSGEPAAAEPVSAPDPEPSAAPVEAPRVEPSVNQAPVPPTPPEPAAAPAPVEPPGPPPGVAATITVPPLDAGESGGGGEWELLVERFTTWWNSGELNRQWQRIRGPLKGVAILLAVLLALQVYATVVRTIDAIPLISGLLELTGLIAVLQFSATRLLRSSDRQEVFAQLQRRWLDFRGRN